MLQNTLNHYMLMVMIFSSSARVASYPTCTVVKSIGCFQRHLFVCVCVCLFVCRHNNFRTSKCKMMKLGGRCTKILADFKFGGNSPLGVHPQKCGVRLLWENQRKLSSSTAVSVSLALPHVSHISVLLCSLIYLCCS